MHAYLNVYIRVYAYFPNFTMASTRHASWFLSLTECIERIGSEFPLRESDATVKGTRRSPLPFVCFCETALAKALYRAKGSVHDEV